MKKEVDSGKVGGARKDMAPPGARVTVQASEAGAGWICTVPAVKSVATALTTTGGCAGGDGEGRLAGGGGERFLGGGGERLFTGDSTHCAQVRTDRHEGCTEAVNAWQLGAGRRLGQRRRRQRRPLSPLTRWRPVPSSEE